MDIQTLALGVAVTIVAIGILGMVGFGIKNLVTGKHDLSKVLAYVVPALIFVIAYFSSGNFTDAGLWTMVISMGILAVLIVLSGIKSTFNL